MPNDIGKRFAEHMKYKKCNLVEYASSTSLLENQLMKYKLLTDAIVDFQISKQTVLT